MGLYNTDVPIGARFSAAARRVSWHERPWVLAYHPVARMNPYQALLYSRGSAAGFAVVAAQELEDMSALTCATAMGAAAVMHLHWTAPVLANASTEVEAATRAEAFLEYFGSLKAQGTKLVWTVHNRLPHRCMFPNVEARLRQQLVAMADVVHIMTSSTPAELTDVVELPANRAMLVEHPSYVGAYPIHHDPELVRFEVGLDPDDFVVGMLGSIQPYKGIDELLDALPAIIEDVPHLRALIAGIPGRDPDSLELIERLHGTAAVHAIPAKLDDMQLSRLASTVDVMALPYRATLNSGAALLALSLGVPVVGPRLGQFVELTELGFCLGYDPEDPRGLADALRRAPEWVSGVDRQALEEYVTARAGPVVSERFFSGLRARLDTTVRRS
jgi:beta-1,4-mannosyltransferase